LHSISRERSSRGYALWQGGSERSPDLGTVSAEIPVGPKWCEIRQTVFGWTTQKFPFDVKTAHALKIREPHVITVTGKAFYDIGHAPADHSNRRSTPKGYAVWEIHPVMKMEVIP
jgi:hypothetical protein